VALENADGGGGDWIDDDTYAKLCQEKALAVLRILRIEEGAKPKPTSRSMWYPVVVDLLILDGHREGEVFRSERMTKAGFTNTLREKFDPRDAELKAKERRKIPRTEGTDLACRFGTYKDNEGNVRYALNAARPDDMTRVAALFAEYDDDPYTAFEKKALSSRPTPSDPTDGETTVDDPDDDLPF
jgi:hypothetical protein